MNLTLKVWRQATPEDEGELVTYEMEDISPFTYFLDLLDQLNEKIADGGNDPVTFDHACRKADCGRCSLFINGRPHGPEAKTTTCLTRLSRFKDGDTIVVEPFRAKPFPVVKDLKVDRSCFDRIMRSGGFMYVPSSGGVINRETGEYTGVKTGTAIDFDTPADTPADPASCINCGACVAACKNASAMLFTSVKIGLFNNLEKEESTKKPRLLSMISAMDSEGFGSCTNFGDCQSACPKGLSINLIADMNREFGKAVLGKALGKVKDIDFTAGSEDEEEGSGVSFG